MPSPSFSPERIRSMIAWNTRTRWGFLSRPASLNRQMSMIMTLRNNHPFPASCVKECVVPAAFVLQANFYAVECRANDVSWIVDVGRWQTMMSGVKFTKLIFSMSNSSSSNPSGTWVKTSSDDRWLGAWRFCTNSVRMMHVGSFDYVELHKGSAKGYLHLVNFQRTTAETKTFFSHYARGIMWFQHQSMTHFHRSVTQGGLAFKDPVLASGLNLLETFIIREDLPYSGNGGTIVGFRLPFGFVLRLDDCWTRHGKYLGSCYHRLNILFT